MYGFITQKIVHAMLRVLSTMGPADITLVVPQEYGYVILVAIGSAFVIQWKAIQVGKARKKFDIPYPTMYSPDNVEFNCIQRAHQNTLENYPQFLMLLLLGGLRHPVVSAAAGVVFLMGRIAFAHGYYTGDPKKRLRGAFGHAGLLVLLGTTVQLACHLLS